MKLPALFLDRDGVINIEKNYVYRISDIEFLPGIFDLTRLAQTIGYQIVIVTNQAGIGRGYYSEEDLLHLTEWMHAQFLANGIRITRTYYCPHHPEHGIGYYRQESFDRKPNPGMLLRAKKELRLDLARSAMIGDRESDMEAALRAGVPERLLLCEQSAETPHSAATWRVRDLAEAGARLAVIAGFHQEAS